MTALTCPRRATHGSDADRRWHQAHGQQCEPRICWQTPDGLPPMPDSTAGPHWLTALIADEFGAGIPDGVAA